MQNLTEKPYMLREVGHMSVDQVERNYMVFNAVYPISGDPTS